MNTTVLGIDRDAAIRIAVAVDTHDSPSTSRTNRALLASLIRRELTEDNKETALDLARLLRRACVLKGIYQRPTRSPKSGTAGRGEWPRTSTRL